MKWIGLVRAVGIVMRRYIGVALLLYSSALLAQAPKEVTILMGSSIYQSPMFVADAKGFFKAAGVDAKVIQMVSGAEAMDSFRAGQGDILMAGDFPSARLWALDKEMIGIAAAVSDEEVPVVVGTKELRQASDLKGKRVATRVGSTFEFFLYRYLASANLRKEDIKLVNLDAPEMVVALDKGEIDAFLWNEPFGMRARAVSGDRVHVLANGKGFFTEWILLSVRRKWADANRSTVTAVLRGLDQANRFIRENRPEATAIIMRYTKIEKPVVDALLPMFRFDVSYTKKLRDDLDAMAGFMMERGALPKHIDWATQFDPSFLKAVRPDLVE
jgi:ABC-type nitrate/sulfonate/bicarbonate transport system substrate-binding protein